VLIVSLAIDRKLPSRYNNRMTAKQAITAIVYDRKGRILAIGQNSYIKTHPLQARAAKATNSHSSKIFQHAEVNALTKIKDWSKAYRMVITRYNKLGEPLTAKPCTCCQWVLTLAKIKVVEHT
jgi:tRNA(Arg) A34 adenosine deaminase TadA